MKAWQASLHKSLHFMPHHYKLINMTYLSLSLLISLLTCNFFVNTSKSGHVNQVELFSRKVIALHFSRMQQEFINHCRTHTIQVTHNPSSWWSEHYRLIAFAFFGKNWEKIATTSILIPFAKFTFMYGGKNLRIPASRSLLRSRFFPKKNTMRVAVWISRHYGHNDYHVMYVPWSVPINGLFFVVYKQNLLYRIPRLLRTPVVVAKTW